MTDQELFERLKKEGECWHEWRRRQVNKPKGRSVLIECKKCGAILSSTSANPDFTTWGGFGWLWDRAQEKEWWTEYLDYEGFAAITYDEKMVYVKRLLVILIHPEYLRDGIAEFLEMID
jgi:hypothetical protein